MNNLQQYYAWLNASKKAQNKLDKQKSKTGVGILGTPPSALISDVKFQKNFVKGFLGQWRSLGSGIPFF